MEDVKVQSDVDMKDTPSSSSSKELSQSLPEEAFNHFLQGKRHMLVQDYTFAVQSLTTACELYVKHFGQMANECAEVHLLYGKALFRLSQQEAHVLGDALNEGSNEEDGNSSGSETKENENESGKNSDVEEEGGELAEDVVEEENNEAESEEKEPSESTDSPQAVVDEGSSEAKAKEASSEITKELIEDATKKESSESKVADDQVTSTNENKTEDPETEEPQEAEENDDDDFEIAWEALETAKTIFQRQGTVESQLKVAEIFQVLAEISLESGNNNSAIEDLKRCLEIQKKHLKPDDRLLAETYYQMGLAQLNFKQYYEALEDFQTTKKILELRLQNVKNAPIDESEGSFASADKDADIKDLENILLDIQEKIDDTEDLIRDAKKEIEDAFASAAVTSPVKEVKEKGETSVSVKPVSNITHLLKRKKPEEVTSDGDTKRIKISSVPN